MSEQEKIALSETQRALVTPIVGGLAAGGIAYGLPAALDKIREVRVRRNRDDYITAMKDVHPDLKGIPKKDLHIAYNSLAMHSPHVLRDPLLGGQELLRMSKYRQADINSLNELNKLRGNSMMDQAFMNATTMVAGGVSEGFKGYQAQRQADADQSYREKMDKARSDMDNARMELENNKLKETRRQFGVRDAYQKDRDAQLDARERIRMRDSKAEADRQFKQRARQFTLTREDNLRNSRVRNKQFKQTHQATLNRDAIASSKNQMEVEKHFAWEAEGRPGPMAIKRASAEHIYDIVARLRDRNL